MAFCFQHIKKKKKKKHNNLFEDKEKNTGSNEKSLRNKDAGGHRGEKFGLGSEDPSLQGL